MALGVASLLVFVLCAVFLDPRVVLAGGAVDYAALATAYLTLNAVPLIVVSSLPPSGPVRSFVGPRNLSQRFPTNDIPRMLFLPASTHNPDLPSPAQVEFASDSRAAADAMKMAAAANLAAAAVQQKRRESTDETADQYLHRVSATLTAQPEISDEPSPLLVTGAAEYCGCDPTSGGGKRTRAETGGLEVRIEAAAILVRPRSLTLVP